MKRHRPGAPPKEESSSDEEDDAFSALTSQKAAKRAKDSFKNARTRELSAPSPVSAPVSFSYKVNLKSDGESGTESNQQALRPVSLTSSMKRHHGDSSGTRKAKMDALLEELKSEKSAPGNSRPSSSSFVPHKKGSYVEAGEEHLTTNIFVGNLATHVTEEQLGDLFRQFGDLYSIKIMWPRGDEEARSRTRHTGFVCFLRREDAEAAMRSLEDTDPFACGRRLTLRWGKNIKRLDEQQSSSSLRAPDEVPQRRIPAQPDRPVVRVEVPQDPRRDRLIRTVADYVAQDGSRLEDLVRERERRNPQFDFLDPRGADHPYYKWRVYAACQGDPAGRRTAPFAMLRGGCLWVVPPPAPPGDSSRSSVAVPSSSAVEPSATASRSDGSARLTAPELEEAHRLFRVELCASRRSVCRAMAFCYDRAHAAHHVAELLRALFDECDAGGAEETEPRNEDDGVAPRLLSAGAVSAETLVSRLYLLSDVLFNSQQPGVRGAFRYRTVVEGLAPDVFARLGRYGRHQMAMGHRWTRQHKLATAVHVVLQAWSKWNVYHGGFLADLQARFDGRPTSPPEGRGSGIAADEEEVSRAPAKDPASDAEADETAESTAAAPPFASVRSVVPGRWTVVGTTDDGDPSSPRWEPEAERAAGAAAAPLRKEADDDGEPLDDDVDLDGEPLEGDAFGEPLDADDVDGEPLDEDTKVDGEPLDNNGDANGKPLDAGVDRDAAPLDRERLVGAADAVSGESLPANVDADGEPLDDVVDGEPLDDSVDGEPLDNSVDGEPLHEEADLDGEPLDEAGNLDGAPLDGDADAGS